MSLLNSLFTRLGIEGEDLEVTDEPDDPPPPPPKVFPSMVQYVEDRNGNRLTYEYEATWNVSLAKILSV